jgi:hypothetical protein
MKNTYRALLVASVGLCACSELTDVKAPGLVTPAAEENTLGAIARYAGAVRSATGALNSAASLTSIWTDEMYLTDFAGNSVDTRHDARRPQNVVWQTGAIFSTYQSARVGIGRAEEALRQYAPTPGGRLGQLYGYMGFIEIYLAEHFCNGIPFSSITDDGVVSYGGAVSTTAIYNMAIAHFDSALAVSTDSARVMNMARVGKGRALLQLGQYAAAAAAVAAVPTSFVFALETNSNTSYGQTNPYYGNILSTSYRGVPAGSEGINGINWVAAADPRAPVYRKTPVSDGVTIGYQPSWVTSYGARQVLTSGVEARLIEAEAALQANNNDAATTGTGWLGILNSLRATAVTPHTNTAANLPPLADPGSYAARVSLLFREHAFWTFLGGQRFGQLRRLVRQYGRPQDTVWPTGLYRDGIPYGTDVNLEPPSSEKPNKLYTGCTDRNA